VNRRLRAPITGHEALAHADHRHRVPAPPRRRRGGGRKLGDQFISPHLGCSYLPLTGGGILTCSYSKGSKKSHFSISSSSAEIKN
jgi:hypothetical protein